MPRWERYPNALCPKCIVLATDEHGRRLRFFNETLLGTGFVAEVDVDGEWRRVDTPDDSMACLVRGKPCRAREHRFGGVVVEAMSS